MKRKIVNPDIQEKKKQHTLEKELEKDLQEELREEKSVYVRKAKKKETEK